MKYYIYMGLFENPFLASIIMSAIFITLAVVLVWAFRLKRKNEELAESEEKFRTIAENSSDIIWHLDSDFRVTYISSADERIRGFNKKETHGAYLWSILKPEGIELLREANKERIANKGEEITTTPAIYELEQICKDGSWVWVEATTSADYDQNGNIVGYHGVSRDISARKKTEQLIKEQENQLRELISTKDKLFSIIAHDLRSPFNAILGFSELLINNTKIAGDQELEQLLGIINSSAKNTLILLDNLLNWAKAQTGQIIYKQEKIDLTNIIADVLEISNSIAKIKNISLNYTQSYEGEVYADVNMLQTILLNLISNAIKFTNLNGEVTIDAKQNGGNVEITVSDNGVGMSEETIKNLFKVDKSLIATGTANEKGSGLGLILCKEFIEKLGGVIGIESEVGKGSDVRFTLPLS